MRITRGDRQDYSRISQQRIGAEFTDAAFHGALGLIETRPGHVRPPGYGSEPGTLAKCVRPRITNRQRQVQHGPRRPESFQTQLVQEPMSNGVMRAQTSRTASRAN